MKTVEYKDSEIWRFPIDWELVTLRDIGSFSKGNGISREDSSTGNIPAIRYGELYVNQHDYIREFTSHISPEIAKIAHPIHRGDLMFTASGETKEDIGKSIAYTGDAVAYAGGDLIILSPNRELNPIFMGYLTNAEYVRKQKEVRGQGDAVVHITPSLIGDIRIALPPLEEQNAIAEMLSSTDSLISSFDKAIEKKRLIKEGLMQELLTGKKRLKGFCGEWKYGELSTLADIQKGVQFDSSLFSAGGRYPMLNGGITPSGYSEYYNTKKDTITISEGGNSCGYVNYMIEDFWCGGHCYSVSVKNVVEKTFLYQLLKYNEKSIMSLRVGSGLPNVQRSALLNFELYFPINKDEQLAISQCLSAQDKETTALQSQREKYLLIKQGMMQELLTGKTRLI